MEFITLTIEVWKEDINELKICNMHGQKLNSEILREIRNVP